MIIRACDLCGCDVLPYATWIEVPVNVDNERIDRVKHPGGQDTTIMHISMNVTKSDYDVCAACFRDTLRRYLDVSTKAMENLS